VTWRGARGRELKSGSMKREWGTECAGGRYQGNQDFKSAKNGTYDKGNSEQHPTIKGGCKATRTDKNDLGVRSGWPTASTVRRHQTDIKAGGASGQRHSRETGKTKASRRPLRKDWGNQAMGSANRWLVGGAKSATSLGNPAGGWQENRKKGDKSPGKTVF